MAVSHFLSFSRAAEQLSITQPAVSHQINTLEDELGVKLFFRTSKRVQLTQAGHLFTEYAQEILALSRLSKDRLKESQQTSVIHFGIGCHNFIELDMLRPVLKQLRGDFPLLQPILRLVSSAYMDNLLEDGDIQAMLTFRETTPKRAAYQELVQQRMVCICGVDHPFASCETLTLQQLREGGCFAAASPHSLPPTLFELQSRVAAGHQSGRICFCDGLESMCALVEAGYAYAVIACPPNSVLPGVRCIPLSGFSPLSFGLAYRKEETHLVLRRFLERMKALFQPET